jgi:hypothetical protein
MQQIQNLANLAPVAVLVVHTAQGGRKQIIKSPPFWCVTPPPKEYKNSVRHVEVWPGAIFNACFALLLLYSSTSDIRQQTNTKRPNDKQQTRSIDTRVQQHCTRTNKQYALQYYTAYHFHFWRKQFHILLYVHHSFSPSLFLFFDRSCPVVLLKLCYGQYNTACRT